MIEQDLKSLVMYIQISLNFALDVPTVHLGKLHTVCEGLQYSQGRRLWGRGDRPPQKVRWRGRRCFYPPIFRKCLTNLHCKKDKNERERRWDPCDRDRHIQALSYPILIYCATLSRFTYSRLLLLFCNLWFNYEYRRKISIIPLNLHIALQNMDCSVYQCKKCKSEGV